MVIVAIYNRFDDFLHIKNYEEKRITYLQAIKNAIIDITPQDYIEDVKATLENITSLHELEEEFADVYTIAYQRVIITNRN